MTASTSRAIVVGCIAGVSLGLAFRLLAMVHRPIPTLITVMSLSFVLLAPDEWEPQKKLGFSIKAQTEHIPATTLDEHVRIGGPYFDTLHGEYEIERLADDRVRLHLRSQHRVSTTFNFYARLWTSAVMSDLQKSILLVIKNRCEQSR